MILHIYLEGSQGNVETEKIFCRKTYSNLITFIASNPSALQGASTGSSFAYILGELKEFNPSEGYHRFDETLLKDNLQDNIYLTDGDRIHIPTYVCIHLW